MGVEERGGGGRASEESTFPRFAGSKLGMPGKRPRLQLKPKKS